MVEILNSGQLNQAEFNSIQFCCSHTTTFAFEFLTLPKKNTRHTHSHPLTKSHNQMARNGKREKNESTSTTTRRQAQIRPNLINADNDNIFIYLSIFSFLSMGIRLFLSLSLNPISHSFISLQKNIFGLCILCVCMCVLLT